MSKSKTASLRLPTKMYDEIDGVCDEVGCTRNDWLKDAVQDKLRIEKSEDQEVIEDTKPQEVPKPTIEEIPEIKEPKVIVEEVPQDNSNKAVVQFIPFNGKLLPFAKRYNT